MRQGSAVHELITLALHEGSDVVILRRRTQSACRATGLTGSPLVRLTTVVSEAGEHLLGASGLTARLSLEVTDVVRVTVRFGWREARRPASALLSAATRLLDEARLLSPGDGGPHEPLLAQRTPAPVSSAGELAAQARASTSADPEETCTRLLDRLPPDGNDDVALMVVRLNAARHG